MIPHGNIAWPPAARREEFINEGSDGSLKFK